MISVNVHRIKSISAHAASDGPFNWVTLNFDGPEEHFELIVHFDNAGAAKAYAAAINGVSVPVDEQRAA